MYPCGHSARPLEVSMSCGLHYLVFNRFRIFQVRWEHAAASSAEKEGEIEALGPLSLPPFQQEPAAMEALLSILRGIRNGAYYGTKIRAPHAFVMVFLFQNGTLREKLHGVVRLTYEHSKNLALFVGVYKTVLAVLRQNKQIVHPHSPITPVGKPAEHWHAAVAGAVGGYLVWGRYSGVNYQIVMYLLARTMISIVRVMARHGVKPFSGHKFDAVYPALATVTWAVVMWLYENEGKTLHPSLRKSMEFLYDESCRWENGLSDFLPSPATAAVMLLTFAEL